jgi:hypothetical protein
VRLSQTASGVVFDYVFIPAPDEMSIRKVRTFRLAGVYGIPWQGLIVGFPLEYMFLNAKTLAAFPI